MCTHNLCFEQKFEKNHNFSSEIITFTAVKYCCILHCRVFVMGINDTGVLSCCEK